MTNPTQTSLSKIKEAQTRPQIDGTMQKAYAQSGSATSGLTYYDLQEGALVLQPQITPLRNRIPRLGSGRGSQANWRAITGINTTGIGVGVSEGNRGGVIATSTQDFMAAFRGLGLEDYVTFEADYAAQGFDDVKSLAVQGLLRALMIGEEKVILGGNSSMPLGTTAAPVLADQPTGGALAAGTQISVRVAGLTMDGYQTASVQGGVRAQVARTNADGSSDSYGGGTAKLSAAAQIGTAGDGNASHKVTASVAPLPGAVAYAWFWGAPGAEVLGAITTINSVTIAAAATGNQTAASLGQSDNSANNLVFDGLLTQIVKPGSNGYVMTMPTGSAGQGTPLTADGVGGIVEIDAALQHFWDVYRLSPTNIWVSSQEQLNITRKVLQGGIGSGQRFIVNVEQGKVMGGDLVTSYVNKFCMDGGQTVAVRPHPNLPAGTILFDTDFLPYPLSGVANILQMRCRRDYYQIEWPAKTRRYEYGVYFDGVLQNYFPPAFGMITNIGNG